jgi:hypothetical protein
VIVAERLLQAFREIEACGYSVKITSCQYVLSGDEGVTSTLVHISEADLLASDAQHAATQRGKLSIVNGGRQ